MAPASVQAMSPFDDPEVVRALRRPGRRLRRQRPARPDRRRSARRSARSRSRARIAASAYRHGAKFVDVTYFDLHVKRARIEHAAEDTLDFVPPWYGERILELGRQRGARIGLTGPVASRACSSDLDPQRAGRDQLPAAQGEPARSSTSARPTGRSCPCPTPAWARLVHPGPRPGRRAGRGSGEQVVPRLPAGRGRPGRGVARAGRRRWSSAADALTARALRRAALRRARAPT